MALQVELLTEIAIIFYIFLVVNVKKFRRQYPLTKFLVIKIKNAKFRNNLMEKLSFHSLVRFMSFKV